MAEEEREEDLCNNWFRGAKGLELLQEGLKDFVGDKALMCRDQQLQNITDASSGTLLQCSQCTSQNLLPDHADLKTACGKAASCIQSYSASCFGSKPRGRRKCPNGICSVLYDRIVYDHRYRDPLWKTTDPTTWCSDPYGWSFAKCFETTPSSGKLAEETDASGLLSIIINNLSMETWLTCKDMGSNKACNFYKAREIRNEILHRPKLELKESTLHNYLDTFIAVLKDTKSLVTYKGSQDGIDKLEKLKYKQVSISQNDQEKFLRLRQEALTEIEIKTIEALNLIEDKATLVKHEIEDTKKEALSTITEAQKRNSIPNEEKTMIPVREKLDVLRLPGDSSTNIYDRQSTILPAQERVDKQTQLKEDLIYFYRDRHWTLPLSPLVEEEGAPLHKFYVMPDIYSVIFQRARGGGNEIKTRIESLRDVFIKENKPVKNIYLAADAGLGKTAFSQRLALTWCQAHKPIENEADCFPEDEIDAIKRFEFLFLLCLRDNSDKCDIDDLIMKLIVQELKHTSLSVEDIEITFSENRCLVILDGLDEWKHPTSCSRGPSEIPHRKARECTILTTSRPWKLTDIKIKSSEIDQRLELAGLNKSSKTVLIRSVISHFSKDTDQNLLEDLEGEFKTALAEHNISEMDSNPLLLMYLLCLWWEKIDPGQSQCELYSGIMELLLSRAFQKYTEPKVEQPETAIPWCFIKQKHCRLFYPFLTSLGRLAFERLFSETRENSLVFDYSMAENVLNEELLTFSLQSSILTQNKIHGRLTKQEAKISFAHKTVQEFIAALYMHSAFDKTTLTVKNKVMSQCNCVKDILAMSNIITFLSGINVSVASSISRELVTVINQDELTQQYRTTTHVYDPEKYQVPLKELQTLYISCMKENPENTNLILVWQDIIIDKTCRQEKYYKKLQQLAIQNKKNVMSVSIKMEGLPYRAQEIIDCFYFSDLTSVHNVYFRAVIGNCDISPLLHRSIQYLSLISSNWQNDEFIGEKSIWSPSISNKVYSLLNLKALNIDCFKISHDQLETLVRYISTRHYMQEILLCNIFCANHGDSCTGCNLNLSHHSGLRTLSLHKIPVSALSTNVSSLVNCNVGRLLSTPGLVSCFLRDLARASNLQTFICRYLETSENVETMLKTLRRLINVKIVSLLDISLDSRPLTVSSKMTNIERITLFRVTMDASVLRDLVNVIQELPYPVSVVLRDCNIKPEEEFQTEKRKIKSLQHFHVRFDNIFKNKQQVFAFQTIK